MLSNLRETEEDLRSLLGSYKAPIQLHTIPTENRSLHRRYRADSPGLFLIRSDGHVAYRGPAEDLDGLRLYLDGLFGGYRERVDRDIGVQSAGRSR